MSRPGAFFKSIWSEAGLARVVLAFGVLLVILSILMVGAQLYRLAFPREVEREVKITVVLPPPAAPEMAQPQATPSESTPPAGETVVSLDQHQAAQVALETAGEAIAAAQDANENTQDAVNTVGMLLNFLEGVAVLAGVALGAAAYFGFRNSREARDDIKDEVDRIQRLETEIQTTLNKQQTRLDEFAQKNSDFRFEVEKRVSVVEQYQDFLKQLPETTLEIKALHDRFEGTFNKLEEEYQNSLQGIKRLEMAIDNASQIVAELTQANQELRLKNFKEAYDAVQRVLARDDNNPVALYLAGWLELQYIPDKLSLGVQHLKKALELIPDWPSATAAYGVALRRQAMQLTDKAREAKLIEAESRLREALVLTPSLLDLNLESFWGPVAGILRDRGEIDKAIQAYEEACNVTPGSSYPHGNLAALYLRKAKEDQNPEWRKKALDLFAKTARLAETELSMVPNDYYHIMDIAMSRMMLSQKDTSALDESLDKLGAALSARPAPEMLEVSLRGWQFLVDHCPDEWTKLKERLNDALRQITQAIAEARQAGKQPPIGGGQKDNDA